MSPTRIHRILDQVGSIAFAGVYDTLSAKLARQAGFPLAFISGYSVAATAIGEPDLGLLTQTEMIERARRICGSVDIPIIVDADTGYGNPLNVYRTVKELIAAALPAASWRTRCGRRNAATCGASGWWNGKSTCKKSAPPRKHAARPTSLSSPAPMPWRRWASTKPWRVTAACQAGADASFVEAPPSLELLAQIGRRAPKPTVANMLEGGKTPVLPKSQLAEMGFQLILYPLTALFAAAWAIGSLYQKLRADGTTLGEEHRLMSFVEFNTLIGVDEKYALAERFGA